MKFFRIILYIAAILTIIYLFGPLPGEPAYSLSLPVVPADALSLEKYIAEKESRHQIKPGNEAAIVWANDSLKQKTDCAIVYLHGFSASKEEGNPVHINIARKLGFNLYLPRLSEHGIDTSEQLLNMTATSLWNSALEAYAIGKQLGKKVIIMSTSTGGTLALKLAAEFPEIHSLVLLSPNIAINNPNAWLLNNHWGLQIARLIQGKYNVPKDTSALYKRYWNTPYRMEALVQLEELLETTMNASTFGKVKQPVLMLYYFKDEQHQDKVVKVSAMQEMFSRLGTPAELKRAVALPDAGDHVLASPIKSKDVAGAEKQVELFAREILKLKL